MKFPFTLPVFIIIILFSLCSLAQTGQIEINRVKQMPDLPSPYKMRNWKEVALKYDAFIYSLNKTGQYLPLVSLKSKGINYPVIQPVFLQTYVGTKSLNQAEAINIIPSIVGASLNGINKSNQDGINWVEKVKDFYNLKNGQNIYLNSYNTTSGKDWWYDLMPNIFFYQLYTQYPSVPDFNNHFITIADQWLKAVYTMGGSSKPWEVPQMNYRAWNLEKMMPFDEGVKEPEAAGAISWLLYNAYLRTGNKNYLNGAEMSMEFLSNLTENPSYELQLPYGVLAAAKMNAEIGTIYNIDKMINWCFERGNLRGWGAIIGTWNGQDISGIIGEANEKGKDYAFLMNGFQHAAALVPMTKYDKRYAKEIAKWVLNLSNASRLFYSKYLPADGQDDFSWSSLHDPESLIAYEALKENTDGKKLYGTGDAKRGGWAETNFGLYGSSHVGYLAAIVDTTDVSGILQLDLNKTDFFGENTFPSYLLYNPHNEIKEVTLKLGNNKYTIYDALTEKIIATNVTSNYKVQINTKEARLLVYLPANASTSSKGNKLYLGEDIVDYHYGYNFEGKLRIKSLRADTNVVGYNKRIPLYVKGDNVTPPITYNWFINGSLSATSTDEIYHWTAPSTAGEYKIVVEASTGNDSAKDSISMTVIEKVPAKPKNVSITQDKKFYWVDESAKIICNVKNEDKDQLDYKWTVEGETYIQTDSLISFKLPTLPGVFTITCTVKNQYNLETTVTSQVLVKEQVQDNIKVLAYYPLNGDTKDYSGNSYNAQISGPKPAYDQLNNPGKAYRFESSNDIIFVPNQTSLNFHDQITLSFWVKADEIINESFVLSHGSYEERWKVSITPTRKLRWTLKTDKGVKDLDSSFPFDLNQFYHCTVIYTGYSLEMYINGILNSYTSHNGLISITLQPITFGKKKKDEELYSFKGTIDEVRIYKGLLNPSEVEKLKDIWEEEIVSGIEDHIDLTTIAYPNPSYDNTFFIKGIEDKIGRIELIDLSGKEINFSYVINKGVLKIALDKRFTGISLLKIKTNKRLIRKKLITN